MRKMLLGFLCYASVMVSHCGAVFCIEISEITDTYLRENPCTDHVQHFQKVFSEAKINSLLEFGLGHGTKFFLEKCRKVTSCEILLPDQTADWLLHTQDLFKNYTNWNPLLIRGSEYLQKANQISLKHKDPGLYDGSYLLELKEICNELFKENSYDIAFVDPGFHMRGDLVNELFDRVPIIAAHDTNKGTNVYGWGKINTPSNYQKYTFSRGQGVIFWVRRDKKDVIAAFNRLFNTTNRKPQSKSLRIFFPQMHPVLVQSMALVLQHLGHILVLPGESFDPNSAFQGLKISYGTFFKKNPLDSATFTTFFSDSPESCSFLKKNVEVIENNELLTRPPDVLFVNCKNVEKDMYKIVKHYKKNKQPAPKLAHYSGNNNTVYKEKYVTNLIAVDAYTAKNYDRFKTNIIFWIPWIDFEHLAFEGVSDSCTLNSYISHYYKDLSKPAALLFYDVVAQAKTNFPWLEINSYPNGKTILHDAMPSLINASCATLHVKKTEGFGYTIIESLAKGRPVFLKRSFSEGSRLMNWCIEGKTAFFFDDYAEFHQKLSRYLSDAEFRHQVQRDCADVIRQMVDNEKQARILDNFLQNLK